MQHWTYKRKSECHFPLNSPKYKCTRYKVFHTLTQSNWECTLPYKTNIPLGQDIVLNDFSFPQTCQKRRGHNILHIKTMMERSHITLMHRQVTTGHPWTPLETYPRHSTQNSLGPPCIYVAILLHLFQNFLDSQVWTYTNLISRPFPFHFMCWNREAAWNTQFAHACYSHKNRWICTSLYTYCYIYQ